MAVTKKKKPAGSTRGDKAWEPIVKLPDKKKTRPVPTEAEMAKKRAASGIKEGQPLDWNRGYRDWCGTGAAEEREAEIAKKRAASGIKEGQPADWSGGYRDWCGTSRIRELVEQDNIENPNAVWMPGNEQYRSILFGDPLLARSARPSGSTAQETDLAAEDPAEFTRPCGNFNAQGQSVWKKPELSLKEYESLEKGVKPSSISNQRMLEIFHGREFKSLTTTERRAYLDGKDPEATTMAFGDMMENPWNYGDQIVRVTDAYIVVRDKFPKSTLHWLLIPRKLKQEEYHFKPLQYLSEDPPTLLMVKEWAYLVLGWAADQLAFMHRLEEDEIKIEGCVVSTTKKLGGKGKKQASKEFWKSQIMVGIHSNPSMAHLHIHFISVDRYSKDLKMRNHYNSFQTPFMVLLNELPLRPDDPRLDKVKAHEFLEADLVCWRCKKTITKNTGKGTDMTKMKDHLEDEFTAWREEWKWKPMDQRG